MSLFTVQKIFTKNRDGMRNTSVQKQISDTGDKNLPKVSQSKEMEKNKFKRNL